MKPPFLITLRQASSVGLTKTFFTLIMLFLKSFSSFLRSLPEDAVVEVNRSKMLLFPKKGGIHLDLFLHHKREPICTQYLAKTNLIRNGDNVVDVGANIGYYVLIESKLVGSRGKIYAIEPVKDNFNLLVKNLEINGLSNVSSYQLAFGGRSGKGEIYVSQHSNLCRMEKVTVEESDHDIVGTQEVQVETVDAFLKDKEVPKLIRMDVEGYEYEIIKGMPETLKHDVVVLMELHPMYLGRKIDPLLKILQENHFKVRFAVVEDKVNENVFIRSIIGKIRGYRLPVYIANASINELRNMIAKNSEFAPNAFFEKDYHSKD